MSTIFDLDKMYCGAIKRGEIFLVHSDDGEKLVVVVQDNVLNERLSTVLAIPIEPHVDHQTVFRNELALKAEETSLGRAAICKPRKISPIDRRYVLAKTGELTTERLQELYEVIDINFGRFRDK